MYMHTMLWNSQHFFLSTRVVLAQISWRYCNNNTSVFKSLYCYYSDLVDHDLIRLVVCSHFHDIVLLQFLCCLILDKHIMKYTFHRNKYFFVFPFSVTSRSLCPSAWRWMVVLPVLHVPPNRGSPPTSRC